MDDFDLQIQDLLENRKDEIYEACMGENSFHKYYMYTFSYEKVEELSAKLDFSDEKYSIADKYDIKKLEELVKENELIDLTYLEPLHALGIGVGRNNHLDWDYDDCLNSCVENEVSDTLEDAYYFQSLRKEFSKFLLVLLENAETDIQIQIKAKKSKDKAILESPELINLMKEYALKAFGDNKYHYDTYTHEQAYKKSVKRLIKLLNSANPSPNYTSKNLPRDWDSYCRQSANDIQTRELKKREFDLKHIEQHKKYIKKYAELDIPEKKEKSGRKSIYSISTHKLILRLTFLLRINDFILYMKSDNIDIIEITDNHCRFIYEYLKMYDLIKDVYSGKDVLVSEGFQLIRSIIQSSKAKYNNSNPENSWYFKEYERVNNFVIWHTR